MTAELLVAVAPLADTDWHHMGGGWWVVMAIGMVAFWAVVIALVVWLVRGGLSTLGADRRERGALEILDRRLAEGSIEVEEYERRGAALGREASSSTDEPDA
jgi:putative membrane protein